jgi:hypothetical protein
MYWEWTFQPFRFDCFFLPPAERLRDSEDKFEGELFSENWSVNYEGINRNVLAE